MVLIKIRHSISTNNKQQQADNDTDKVTDKAWCLMLLDRASL
jgi:hypothetical protein